MKNILHVDSSIYWRSCSGLVGGNYKKELNSTHLYKDFFEAGLKILIYSGNADA